MKQLTLGALAVSFGLAAGAALLAEAGEDRETAVEATFDLDALANQRAAWGLFRDRRPELYDPLLTLDGEL